MVSRLLRFCQYNAAFEWRSTLAGIDSPHRAGSHGCKCGKTGVIFRPKHFYIFEQKRKKKKEMECRCVCAHLSTCHFLRYCLVLSNLTPISWGVKRQPLQLLCNRCDICSKPEASENLRHERRMQTLNAAVVYCRARIVLFFRCSSGTSAKFIFCRLFRRWASSAVFLIGFEGFSIPSLLFSFTERTQNQPNL